MDKESELKKKCKAKWVNLTFQYFFVGLSNTNQPVLVDGRCN